MMPCLSLANVTTSLGLVVFCLVGCRDAAVPVNGRQSVDAKSDMFARPEMNDFLESFDFGPTGRLQGCWKVLQRQYPRDQLTPLGSNRSITLLVRGRHFVIIDRAGGSGVSDYKAGTLKLDDSRAPKSIDLQTLTKHVVGMGIYELEDDKLRIQWNADGLTRAARVTEVERGHYLEVFARNDATTDRDELRKRLWKSLTRYTQLRPSKTAPSKAFLDLTRLPGDERRPWVLTQTELPATERIDIAAGYIGKTSSGEWLGNYSGVELLPGRAGLYKITQTFKPRVTCISYSDELGLNGRHELLEPGQYLFYMAHHNQLSWQVATIEPDAQMQLKLKLDPTQRGDLSVAGTTSQAGERPQITILPLRDDGQPSIAFDHSSAARRCFRAIRPYEIMRTGDTLFLGLSPGKYRVYSRASFRDVVIVHGQQSAVSFDSE